MDATRIAMPRATFPPFEPSHWDIEPEHGVTLYISLPSYPMMRLSLITLSVSIILLTMKLKDHLPSMRSAARPAPSRALTKENLDILAKQLADSDAQCTSNESLLDNDLPSPSRSASNDSHHSNARPTNPRVAQTLRRTKSFSAHLLENSTRPILIAQRAVVNQFTTMGREVLKPMRTMRHPAQPTIPESSTPEPPMSDGTASDASSSARSSTDSQSDERRSQGSSAATAVSAPTSAPSSSVSRPSSGKKAARLWAKARVFVFTRTVLMPSSAPSNPERTGRSSTRSTTSVKGGVRRTANKNGEPIRYARPARPENQMSEVIFETRFESPVKKLFRSKPKGNKDNSPTKKTNAPEGLSLMKSSVSLRRLFCSPATEDAAPAGECAASDGSSRSRRSSMSSSTTGAPSSVRSGARSDIAGSARGSAIPRAHNNAPSASSATSGSASA